MVGSQVSQLLLHQKIHTAIMLLYALKWEDTCMQNVVALCKDAWSLEIGVQIPLCDDPKEQSL